MEQRVSLITLGVADVQRARAFYEALGWRAADSAAADVVFFQAGGMVVALWDRVALAADSGVEDPHPGGFGGFALAHNVASPAAVDAVLDEARAAGATVTRVGGATFWG
ncbi:MAG: VOC family protein, partial [Solirubrobacterales bacterium]|nr:VOC family protein [Solirubrobacterales bacterium]